MMSYDDRHLHLVPVMNRTMHRVMMIWAQAGRNSQHRLHRLDWNYEEMHDAACGLTDAITMTMLLPPLMMKMTSTMMKIMTYCQK